MSETWCLALRLASGVEEFSAHRLAAAEECVRIADSRGGRALEREQEEPGSSS